MNKSKVKYIFSSLPISGNFDPIYIGPILKFESKLEEKMMELRNNFVGDSSYFIYENKDYFPRFFTVNNIEIVNNQKSLYNKLNKAKIEKLRSVVLIDSIYSPNCLFQSRTFSIAPNNNGSKEKVNLVSYSNDEIRLINNGGDTNYYLIVTNSYSPYWKCEIDGEDREIYPA